MNSSRWVRSAAAISVSLALWSCASERPPVNRVQANALEKSFFVGEIDDPNDDPAFFWRNFVVDASESQSMIGIGSWSGVDRIRWEISENMLFARRAYQQNPGADDKGTPSETNGTMVAAYPIESHFDIRREYNPSTGEELNVIVENTSDRPWHDREFMRVDWSVNLVDTPLWYDMFAGKVFGEISVTPLAYFVGDADHEDAPHFYPDEGYFDVTSKFWVEPSSVAVDGGSLPMCVLMGLFTGNALDNCDPQEATIRSSYLRVDQVDPDSDFEPFENSRAPLDIVGNPGGLGDAFSVGVVTPPRIEWDPQYGYTDANLQRFMHVHNIWEQSHQTIGSCSTDSDCDNGTCLPSGQCSLSCDWHARSDDNRNGTDDQCENNATDYEGSEGSQCSYRNRCTIPYRDRVVKPIVFWMNKETPEELTDETDADGDFVSRGPTEDLVYTWNQALKQSVAKAREVECRRTGGTRDDCHAEFFEPDGIEMVSYGGWGIEQVKKGSSDVLLGCHNPVRSYDSSRCGEVGYSARVGDLRHNFLFYWPYASRAPWGGIANWNADPLTGQIIGASATTMGRSATFSAALTRDIIMVANGERSLTDITDGFTAFLYEKELQDGRRPRIFTKEELDARVASIDPENALATIGAPNIPIPEGHGPMGALAAQKLDMVAGLGVPISGAAEFNAVAGKLAGSLPEAQLIDPNWLFDLAALPAGTELTDDVMDLVSPLRGADSFDLAQFQRLMNLRYQARGICFTEPEAANVGNEDVQGVAAYYMQKYSDEALAELYDEDVDNPPSASFFSDRRAELIYDDLWKESYKGIQLHEMGHALGLLHQFTSSYDSTNYNPQYWQLRTQEGRATRSCEGEPRTGTADEVYDAANDSCMGPRYLDPATDDEMGRRIEGTGSNARHVDPRPGINYFAHTSTMEYQNERFFESVGLGQYDLHAMNVLYGRVIQTFDSEAEDGLSQDEQAPFMGRLFSQLIDDQYIAVPDATTSSFVDLDTVHYTEAARMMRLFNPNRCRTASPLERERAEWRIVHDKVCSPPPKDYAAWDDFTNQPFSSGGQPLNLTAPHAQVLPGLPNAGSFRWPYRWGVGTNSYPHANSVDAGADMYELTVETIKKFEYSYIYNYFRRARRDWYYGGVPARTAGAFFERLRAYHWGIASYNSFLRSLGAEDYNGVASSDDRWRPYLIAETEMFNAIARAVLMPQIGEYFKADNFQQSDADRDIYDPDGTVTDAEGQISLGDPGNFVIDASTGRYIDPAFAWGPDYGGSWDYQTWIGRVGFGAEKVDALRTLVDGRSVFSFVSRSNYLDGRNLNVNFRSDMGRAVDRLLGGVLARDWEAIAPYVSRGVATPEVQIMDLNSPTPSRPPASDAHLLFPNVSYRQQLGALIWGHVFSRLNTDLSLSNKLRIYVDGFQSQIQIPDSQQIRFYNPESGFTYIARRYGREDVDGRSVDKGIASRMLERANLLLVDAFEVERDSDGEVIVDAYGVPQLVLDDQGFEIPKAEYEEIALNTLRNYVGLIDMAAQVNDLVGYGPIVE